MDTTPAADGTNALRVSSELFFAKVPPSLSTEAVAAVFNNFGACSVNLFKRWPTARTSKGCGIVTFEEKTAAAAALEELHGKFTWPESEVPIVVEWMDAAKQKPVPPKPAATNKPSLQQKFSPSNTCHKNLGLLNVPCRQQNKEASSLVQQLLGNTLLLPSARQQHSSAVADEQQMMPGSAMGYVACYAANNQYTLPLDGHLGSWDMAGAIPVHLLPITAALQGKACTPDGSASSLNMDPSLLAMQQQQQASMAMRPSSCTSVGTRMGPAALTAPAAEWACFDSHRFSHPEEVQQSSRMFPSGVLAAPSCSTSQMLLGNSSFALEAGAMGSQRPAVLLPEGVLQMSDSWVDSGCLRSPGIGQQQLDACTGVCTGVAFSGQAVLQTAPFQQTAMYDGAGDGQDSGSMLSGSSVMFSPGGSGCVSHRNGMGQVVDGAGLFAVPTLQAQPSMLSASKQMMPAGQTMLPASSSPPLSSAYVLQANGPAASAAAVPAPAADVLGPLLLDVSPEMVGRIASVMGAIKSISSAQIELVAAEGGLKLRLAGSPSQVQSAVSLYNVALAAN